MTEYLILDKEETNLPMLIYIGKGESFFHHIMFQNDYDSVPNKDNLIKMNIDGSIDTNGKKIGIKQEDIDKLVVLFEENERNIVSYWHGDITKEEFLKYQYSKLKYSKYIGIDLLYFPFTRPVFKDLYKQLKKQNEDIYVGNQYDDKSVFDYIIQYCEKFVDYQSHVNIIKKYKPKSIEDLSIMVEHISISDVFCAENQAENKILLQNLLEKRLEETKGIIAYSQQWGYVINLICDEPENPHAGEIYDFCAKCKQSKNSNLYKSKVNNFKKMFYSKCAEKQLIKQEIDKLWKIIYSSCNLPILNSSEAIDYAKNIYRLAYLHKNYC